MTTNRIQKYQYTWEDLLAMSEGTKVYEEVFSTKPEIKFIILRNFASLCAYIGVPLKSPLAKHPPEGMQELCAHWGINFADKGDGEIRPKGYWWYGWDYAHAGDYAFYFDHPKVQEFNILGNLIPNESKKWLVEDVIEDSRKILEECKEILLLEDQWRKST